MPRAAYLALHLALALVLLEPTPFAHAGSSGEVVIDGKRVALRDIRGDFATRRAVVKVNATRYRVRVGEAFGPRDAFGVNALSKRCADLTLTSDSVKDSFRLCL